MSSSERASEPKAQATRRAKPQRQHRIATLLGEHPVTSQGHLVELLAASGVMATQATVSRDLEDLGAVKVRVPGGESVYAIPELAHERIAPEDNLRRVLGDWLADVSASANLAVLRTPPGSAHVVASALDRAGLSGVLGSVAGDDTILVVTASPGGGAAVARRLAALAGLREPATSNNSKNHSPSDDPPISDDNRERP